MLRCSKIEALALMECISSEDVWAKRHGYADACPSRLCRRAAVYGGTAYTEGSLPGWAGGCLYIHIHIEQWTMSRRKCGKND